MISPYLNGLFAPALVLLVACGELPPQEDIGQQRSVDDVCEATHAKVGQTATLSTHAHGVSGNARVVDNCTIELTEFHFDGGGVDARMYLALDGDWETGFPVSDNLVGDHVFVDETMTLKLPTQRSLDDMNGIALWCIPFAAAFGNGQFN